MKVEPDLKHALERGADVNELVPLIPGIWERGHARAVALGLYDGWHGCPASRTWPRPEHIPLYAAGVELGAEARGGATVFNVQGTTLATPIVRGRCRVCGCTDEDCRVCVERTHGNSIGCIAASDFEVSATLCRCRRCGRTWGRVEGLWHLDPETTPDPAKDPCLQEGAAGDKPATAVAPPHPTDAPRGAEPGGRGQPGHGAGGADSQGQDDDTSSRPTSGTALLRGE